MRGLARCGWGLAAALSLTTVLAHETALADGAAAQPAPSKRAWLGVDLEKGPAGGVKVKHAINNSPAAKAGFADGDQIVEVDGDAVDEPSQVVARVALAGPGASISVKIRRGDVEKTLSATLAPHPGQDQILKLDKLGTFAPWKPVTTVSGSVPANMAALRGKVVVIDFWASWCGACKLMTPHLSKIQTTYSSQGLTVIGVTTDEAKIAAKAAQKQSMTYAVASDANETATAAYGVKVLPTLFVIDKKGVIREIFTGFDSGKPAELEKLVKKLLAEPAPPPAAAPATSASAAASAGAPPAAPAPAPAPTTK
ncbi:MAG: redoxin family protein [Polyangiaceae bacterium]|nr:redoxin family protein [Polyangiaceae bacterium]